MVVVEGVAVDFRTHELAEEIALGPAPAVGDDRLEVGGHRLRRRLAPPGVAGPEVDLVGPDLELVVVLEGNADDGSDHLHREAGREVVDEVGLALGRDPVEQGVDRGSDDLVGPALERRGPKS